MALLLTNPLQFFLEASSAEEAQQWLQTLFTISWNEGGAPWDLTDVPASASVASSTPVPYSFLASLPHCQLSGWLQKNKIGADTGWKRRWFILKENLLFYCKDASDIEPLGAFDLEGCELRVATRSQAIEVRSAVSSTCLPLTRAAVSSHPLVRHAPRRGASAARAVGERARVASEAHQWHNRAHEGAAPSRSWRLTFLRSSCSPRQRALSGASR